MRLEGWQQASCSPAPFETAASQLPQGEVGLKCDVRWPCQFDRKPLSPRPSGTCPAGSERGRSSGVEHDLAKVGVEGSNPFARSNFPNKRKRLGDVALARACVPSVWWPHDGHRREICGLARLSCNSNCTASKSQSRPAGSSRKTKAGISRA